MAAKQRTGSGSGERRIAILGGGNLGQALARGWIAANVVQPGNLRVVRRRPERLAELAELGIRTSADNLEATRSSDLLVIAVQPQQIESLLEEIRPAIEPARHHVISVVSGVSLNVLRHWLGDIALVRAMPNTAVAIRESMTCLSATAARSGNPWGSSYTVRRARSHARHP